MRAFNPTFQASMATGRGAKPIDAAQASLRELCSVLESSESTPALVTRNVLVNLGMVDEVQELDAAMADDVKNAERLADGEAGNSVKYEAAAVALPSFSLAFVLCVPVGMSCVSLATALCRRPWPPPPRHRQWRAPRMR